MLMEFVKQNSNTSERSNGTHTVRIICIYTETETESWRCNVKGVKLKVVAVILCAGTDFKVFWIQIWFCALFAVVIACVRWCLCKFAYCWVAKMRRVTLAVRVCGRGCWCEIVKFSCGFSSFIMMMIHFNLRKILRHFWCNRNKTTAHSLRAPLTQIHSISFFFFFIFANFVYFSIVNRMEKRKSCTYEMLNRNANSWKRRRKIKKIVKKFCNFFSIGFQ